MDLNDVIKKAHKTIEAIEITSISQSAMAERIGVKPRTYVEYCRGTNKPLAMKALLNMLAQLDDENILKMVHLWESENRNNK